MMDQNKYLNPQKLIEYTRVKLFRLAGEKLIYKLFDMS